MEDGRLESQRDGEGEKFERQQQEGSEPQIASRCVPVEPEQLRGSRSCGESEWKPVSISNGGLNSSDTQDSCQDTRSKHPHTTRLIDLETLYLVHNNSLISNLIMNPNT